VPTEDFINHVIDKAAQNLRYVSVKGLQYKVNFGGIEWPWCLCSIAKRIWLERVLPMHIIDISEIWDRITPESTILFEYTCIQQINKYSSRTTNLSQCHQSILEPAGLYSNTKPHRHVKASENKQEAKRKGYQIDYTTYILMPRIFKYLCCIILFCVSS